MIDSHNLKPILMINDCITNDELKIICYNCITDCKTNCCGCKKNYPIHHIMERILLMEMLYAL